MNTNKPSLIGIRELLKISIFLFKRNIGAFVGIAGILMLLSIAMGLTIFFFGILGGILADYKVETGILSALKASLALLALFAIFMWMVAHAWVSGSLTVAVREIASENVITIKNALIDGWLIKWSFLLVTILFGLVIAGGFILLIVPSMIFFIWYFFSPYVLVCENTKGWAALSRSKELVSGNWWGVAVRISFLISVITVLSLILSNIPHVGVFLNMLFQLLALPFSTIFCFVLYENLKTVKCEE